MANNDVSPTDWASEKFRAEVEQIRASIEVERQKAASAVAREQAEVASLNAPFYKKSSFWTTVVPIITATATVFFYLNNQFNADYAKMKSDLDRTKVELLQANADLADFKNQRAEQQLKEAQDQKAMVAKQIAGANSQLDLLKKQLAEESEKLGDAPIVTLIDAVIRRSESEFPSTSWDDALQGQLLKLAMANPNSPALLQEGIDSTTNFVTKAQFIVIAFDAAGDVKFREALFDLGKLAISQKVSDYAFWSIFSLSYGKPFDEDMERDACSLLMDAYVAGVRNAGDDEGRMAEFDQFRIVLLRSSGPGGLGARRRSGAQAHGRCADHAMARILNRADHGSGESARWRALVRGSMEQGRFPR